jgi:hypothetical protein
MNGTTVNGELNHELESRGFDGNDGLESHMASYEFLMSDGPAVLSGNNLVVFGLGALQGKCATTGSRPSATASA